jgi:hypothetical protein
MPPCARYARKRSLMQVPVPGYLRQGWAWEHRRMSAKIGGRLEYESFNIPNTNGARVFSLSVFLNLMWRQEP